MPYYIYRVTERPIRQLEKLEQHEAYKEASARAKQLRKDEVWGTNGLIKMIHAENELAAEDLLNQVRDPVPEGDD
ncbi:MAG: hypothetical protein AUJ90_02135 [Gallionellaceae bacterium CG1_02_60_948]|nr:MAG: hypothetical protein AUJ90_02135 [Gallionellaceae bacterium CG1_02_60_948]PIU17008.1 MAG: hypothetical protein COT19_03115 [Gallionellales bacterium CG08_land_8_20_14_0_20_59_87]PJC02824.1 MAG: hypothetical protein CO071_01115 [Gallionellales bacterium CG_4_9_14_0_8_um_filter_59_50]